VVDTQQVKRSFEEVQLLENIAIKQKFWQVYVSYLQYSKWFANFYDLFRSRQQKLISSGMAIVLLLWIAQVWV